MHFDVLPEVTEPINGLKDRRIRLTRASVDDQMSLPLPSPGTYQLFLADYVSGPTWHTGSLSTRTPYASYSAVCTRCRRPEGACQSLSRGGARMGSSKQRGWELTMSITLNARFEMRDTICCGCARLCEARIAAFYNSACKVGAVGSREEGLCMSDCTR